MDRFGIGSLTFYTASLRHGNAVLGAMRLDYVVLCERHGNIACYKLSHSCVVRCIGSVW